MNNQKSKPKSGRGRAIILVAAVAAAIGLLVFLVFRNGETPRPLTPTTPGEESLRMPETPQPPRAEDIVIPDSAEQEAAPGEAQPGQAPRTPQSVEDAMFPMAFVSDLAAFAVANYQPGGTRANPGDEGLSTLSFKKVNMRYGLDVSHFGHTADSLPSARSQIFDYLFTDSMLRMLYDLYAEPFVAEIMNAADRARREVSSDGQWIRRPLKPDEKAEMLRLHAEMLRGGAAVFGALAVSPEVLDSVGNYLVAADAVNDAYEAYWEKKGFGDQDLADAGERIRQAVLRRETVKREIIDTIRATPARYGEQTFPEDDTILYLATWVYRRSAESDSRLEHLPAMRDVLADMAARLEARAGVVGGA